MKDSLLRDLRKKQIVSGENVKNLRQYIALKYGSDDQQSKVRVFADAVKRVLNEKIPRLGEEERNSLRDRVLREAVSKQEFAIDCSDILKAAFQVKVLGTSNGEEWTKWLNSELEQEFTIEALHIFTENVYRLFEESPDAEWEEIITKAEQQAAIDKYYKVQLKENSGEIGYPPETERIEDTPKIIPDIVQQKAVLNETGCEGMPEEISVDEECNVIESIYLNLKNDREEQAFLSEAPQAEVGFECVEEVLEGIAGILVIQGNSLRSYLRKCLIQYVEWFIELLLVNRNKRRLAFVCTVAFVIMTFQLSYGAILVQQAERKTKQPGNDIELLAFQDVDMDAGNHDKKNILFENERGLNSTGTVILPAEDVKAADARMLPAEAEVSLEKKKQNVSRGQTVVRGTRLNMRATAYDLSVESCGKERSHPQYGITFSGVRAALGRTIAVDPDVIPLGSRVYITFPERYKNLNGEYIAEDTGRLVKGMTVDIFLGEDKPGETIVKQRVKQFGIQKVEVVLLGN